MAASGKDMRTIHSQPYGMIVILYAGMVMLAVGLVTLGIGLIRANDNRV